MDNSRWREVALRREEFEGGTLVVRSLQHPGRLLEEKPVVRISLKNLYAGWLVVVDNGTRLHMPFSSLQTPLEKVRAGRIRFRNRDNPGVYYVLIPSWHPRAQLTGQ